MLEILLGKARSTVMEEHDERDSKQRIPWFARSMDAKDLAAVPLVETRATSHKINQELKL